MMTPALLIGTVSAMLSGEPAPKTPAATPATAPATTPSPARPSAPSGPSSGPPSGSPSGPPSGPPLDWKTLEADLLTEHVQITSRERFVKAGEAYFDHDLKPRWIIFQAIEVPRLGAEVETHYAMYVARLRYDGHRIVGAEEPIRISTPGSANTCGWFHPRRPHEVLFASTLKAPSNTERPGFRVGTRNYVWQFPDEMEIVTRSISEIAVQENSEFGEQARGYQRLLSGRMPAINQLRVDGKTDEFNAAMESLRKEADAQFPLARAVKNWTGPTLFEKPKYTAECSYSPDGRHVLYAQVREEPTRGKDDADIWVFDTVAGTHTALITADGYDGGPFFSPDGTRICYRSDRVGDDKLQLFVAELKIENGAIVGVERETQITADEHVNWAPYWHPSGAYLVYGTSAMGHFNYEVFAVRVPARGAAPEKAATTPPQRRRVTQAGGADVLPAFSSGGHWLIWTAQRGPLADGETRASSQVWIARVRQGRDGLFEPESFFADATGDRK